MSNANITDFNIRYPGHPKYNVSRIVEDRTMEFLLQKVEMILYTNQGDLLSDPNFGCNIEYYLWSIDAPVEKIQSVIQEQINTYIPELNQLQYNLNVEVQVYQGTLRDILYININIKNSKLNFIIQ
jgi:phage baseplate assembly protein W